MTQKVLLLGATGETGHWILDGLLEDGSFVHPSFHQSNGYFANMK